jgi:elongation factor P--beta-lysine ligase
MLMSTHWSSTALKNVELIRTAITPTLRAIHAEQELLEVRSAAVSNGQISRDALNAPAFGVRDTELAFRPTYRLLPPSPSR